MFLPQTISWQYIWKLAYIPKVNGCLAGFYITSLKHVFFFFLVPESPDISYVCAGRSVCTLPWYYRNSQLSSHFRGLHIIRIVLIAVTEDRYIDWPVQKLFYYTATFFISSVGLHWRALGEVELISWSKHSFFIINLFFFLIPLQ